MLPVKMDWYPSGTTRHNALPLPEVPSGHVLTDSDINNIYLALSLLDSIFTHWESCLSVKKDNLCEAQLFFNVNKTFIKNDGFTILGIVRVLNYSGILL